MEAINPKAIVDGNSSYPLNFTTDHQTASIRFSVDLAGSNLSKYMMLRYVQDQNEQLFYHYIRDNIRDSLPYIYTPSVGDACQKYSYLAFQPRGLYLTYRDNEDVRTQLESISDEIDVIVVTDGSRVLGLGDQGIGGMGISIGKLSLYTAIGGIPPERTLPVCIDVGTNNPELKNDPLYRGDKEDRIEDDAFYAYLEEIMVALTERWPQAIIQFEDFSNNHAFPLLEQYRNRYRCFNDDIQGTATVGAATIKRALLKIGKDPARARVFIVGGGSAGCGIGQLVNGCFDFEPGYGVYLLDREGVVFADKTASPVQRTLARPVAERPEGQQNLELLHAIEAYQPDVLIGVTGATGLFDETIIRALAAHTRTPVIMPLSNPVSACEVTPQQIYDWIGSDVIVATGSPFSPVQWHKQHFTISQCNNVYVFPGIGLGAKAVAARTISDGMLMRAIDTLATFECPLMDQGEVLPVIENTIEVSKAIAIAVAWQAVQEGLAGSGTPQSQPEITALIDAEFWHPHLN